ncbi:HipA domain-containing protein [Caballeronia ptereochthonis]|uniref:HipA domain-containing protein n=1 Tax=Caballeronia ptereochthonis TaxID=1777144 RepID=A0A158CY28_9BURK|nr:HipA domain-containing protein [Caballeronia ptereochthonis]
MSPEREDQDAAPQVLARPESRRNLIASINDVEVGVLNADDDIWSFTYLPSWRENADGYPLSPALPLQADVLRDGGTRRPVQWYFDNLLPEEGQRTLLARDAAIRNEADAFALLAHYGAESAGSVTLCQPGARDTHELAERPLPDEALQARIDALPRVPLTHDAIKRMSLAGAQHKLAVVLRDDALYEPAAARRPRIS